MFLALSRKAERQEAEGNSTSCSLPTTGRSKGSFCPLPSYFCLLQYSWIKVKLLHTEIENRIEEVRSQESGVRINELGILTRHSL
jgi:hypothetical protein